MGLHAGDASLPTMKHAGFARGTASLSDLCREDRLKVKELVQQVFDLQQQKNLQTSKARLAH